MKTIIGFPGLSTEKRYCAGGPSTDRPTQNDTERDFTQRRKYPLTIDTSLTVERS